MSTKIKTIMLRALGLQSFAKKPDGREFLTDEQSAELASRYGEQFATSFAAYLSNDQQSSSDDSHRELMDLITLAKTPEITRLERELSAAQGRNDSLQSLVDQLAGDPETAPAAEGIRAATAAIERSFKVNMNASHYQGAAQFLSNDLGATPSIDVADLKKEFGTYLGSATNTELHKKIFFDFEASKYMTTKIADHEWRATHGLISSIVQQFTPKWTPTGKVKFTPITIRNRRHKINVELRPNDVVESWMLYMYDESLSPDKMPITRYITQELIMPQILEDIEMRMVAKGKYDEAAAEALKDGDSGLAPEKGMDGFETILAEGLKVEGTEGDIGVNYYKTAFDYRNCTDREMLDFTAGYVDSISPFYRKKNMPVFCSEDFYKRYKRAYKNIYGVGVNADPEFGGDRIDYSQCVLTPMQSMYASPILFTTPKENFIKLRRQKDTTQLINDVQKVNYDVKLFGEFWLGVGFAIGEAVTAFVPAGYDPYATIAASMGASDSLSRKGWLGSNAVYTNAPAGEGA